MFAKLGSLVVLAFVGNVAMASYAVQCGSKTDVENGEVKGEVLALSSEDENFTGAASKEVDGWEMTYEKVEYPPHRATIRAIKAPGTEHTSALEVTIISVKTKRERIGQRLLIVEPYSDEPTLEVYQIGGFAGGVKTATYPCISFVD